MKAHLLGWSLSKVWTSYLEALWRVFDGQKT